MKNILLFFIIILISNNIVLSQEKMFIHKTNKTTLGAPISLIDSIYFTSNCQLSHFQIGDSLFSLPTSEIDSITFGQNTDSISVVYNQSVVQIFNPLAFEGVNIINNGAHVTILSSIDAQDINYNISGTSNDGMFKIYSNKRFNLLLNNIHLTNPIGPAINIQSEKKASIIIMDQTNNVLSDGTVYSASPLNGQGEEEDQKAALFSEAKLSFSGNGILHIQGNAVGKHAICSDDVLQINSGTIIVEQAENDGLHGKDGIEINGGNISVHSSGDAIDGDKGLIKITAGEIITNCSIANANGIACDSILTISGGTLNITVTGSQSKGIKSNQQITLNGGDIQITNSGDAVLEAAGSGFNPSYNTAIKSKTSILINGAQLTVTSSGKGSKSVSSDGNIEIISGTINITNSGTGVKYTNSSGVADVYASSSLSADGNLTISGGTITTSNSGSAGKGISADGTFTFGSDSTMPTIQITTTGAKVLISGSNYAEAKAISCDGNIVIKNGNIVIASADDAIKSKSSVTIDNATVTVNNSIEGIESPIITIVSGNIKVKSSDDCLNASYGNGGEGNDGSLLNIQGGNVVVSGTGGDALDSNGNILITGGVVIAHGPQSSPEVGMDYNGICNMNGGVLIISGTNSFMTQAPNSSSQQRSVYIKSSASISASNLFHIQDANNNNILTFKPERNYYSIVFSSSELISGASYSIYTGGSCTGTNNNGLYSNDGAYSGGTFKKNFTISGIITNVTM